MITEITTHILAFVFGAGFAYALVRERLGQLKRLRHDFDALAYEHKRWTDRGPGGRFKGGK